MIGVWISLLCGAILGVVSANNGLIIEFTDANFKKDIKRFGLILVEFYAPWCAHCKNLAPEYEKAAARLWKHDPPVPLAKVDCIKEKQTCEDNHVKGYPTLKIFKNGELYQEYAGPRDADGIVKTLSHIAGPISRELKTVKDFNDFLHLARDDACVIGFFKDMDSYTAKTFETVAETYGDLKFAHTTGDEIKAHAKFKEEIVLYRPKSMENKFENTTVSFGGDLESATLRVFIDEERFGLCGHRNALNAHRFKKPLFIAFYNVDYLRNPKGSNYWRNRVLKVAKKIHGEPPKLAYFAVSNKEEHIQEVQECGLGDSIGEKPVVCAYDDMSRKFMMEDEFSVETFEKFVRGVLAGEADPYIKSEPLPDNTGKALKTVVSKNFDWVVNNPQKDVLIEFYAPWCAHCQELEPKYEQLAQRLRLEPDITVARMDATANDTPTPYEVTGFPVIYFVPRKYKEYPRKYEGPKELEDMLKYVAREATAELKGYDRKGNKKTKEAKKKKKKEEKEEL